MERMKLLLFTLLLSTSLSAAKDLTFSKISFSNSSAELSGITVKNRFLYAIADKPLNHYIYKVNFNQIGLILSPFNDLKQKEGFLQYIASTTVSREGGHILKSPLDLEGIAYCDDIWYLVNEQARHILKVEGPKIAPLKIDFANYFEKMNIPFKDLDANAGFEGLAIDCENNIFYVAQERSPRGIIVVNGSNMEVSDFFNIPTERPEATVNEDFSDLFFDRGHLYILERNFYAITKINPKTKAVIDRVHFEKLGKFNLKNLYKTGNKFGIAEGLTMSEDTIYISVDNNQNTLTDEAKKHFDENSNHSAILFFQRPPGF